MPHHLTGREKPAGSGRQRKDATADGAPLGPRHRHTKKDEIVELTRRLEESNAALLPLQQANEELKENFDAKSSALDANILALTQTTSERDHLRVCINCGYGSASRRPQALGPLTLGQVADIELMTSSNLEQMLTSSLPWFAGVSNPMRSTVARRQQAAGQTEGCQELLSCSHLWHNRPSQRSIQAPDQGAEDGVEAFHSGLLGSRLPWTPRRCSAEAVQTYACSEGGM